MRFLSFAVLACVLVSDTPTPPKPAPSAPSGWIVLDAARWILPLTPRIRGTRPGG